MSSSAPQDTASCPVRHDWDPSTGVELETYYEVEEVLRRGRDFVMSGARHESLELVGDTLVAIDGRPHLDRRKVLTRMLRPELPWGAEGHLFDSIFDVCMQELRAKASPADEIRFDLIEFARGHYWRLISAFIGIDGIETEADVNNFMGLSVDRKSTRLNSSHSGESRMPSSA